MYAILQRRLAVSGLLAGLALVTGLLLGQPLAGGLPAALAAGESGNVDRRPPAQVQEDTEAAARRTGGSRARDLSWPFFSFGRNGGRRSW